MAVSLTQLVGVQGATSRADRSSDRGAFPSTRERANAGAGNRRARYRQFVTVLLPESSMPNVPMTRGLR